MSVIQSKITRHSKKQENRILYKEEIIQAIKMEPEIMQMIELINNTKKSYPTCIPYAHNVEENKSMLRTNMKDIKMIQTDLLNMNNTLSEIKYTEETPTQRDLTSTFVWNQVSPFSTLVPFPHL